VETEHKMGSVRDLESIGTFKTWSYSVFARQMRVSNDRLTFSLQSVELVEERGNVNDDTGPDEASTLLVDET
jgi:hypothetical protein